MSALKTSVLSQQVIWLPERASSASVKALYCLMSLAVFSFQVMLVLWLQTSKLTQSDNKTEDLVAPNTTQRDNHNWVDSLGKFTLEVNPLEREREASGWEALSEIWNPSWHGLLQLTNLGILQWAAVWMGLSFTFCCPVFTGENGTIDGQGWVWWDMVHNRTLDYTRGHLVELINSTNILISNLTFVNSPFWTIHPVYCR
jgi:polygalacturonase